MIQIKANYRLINLGLPGLLLIFAAPPGDLSAKTGQNQTAPQTPPRRVVRATKTYQPITLDGQLKEDVWLRAPASGFKQTRPKEGADATASTEVWVAYDKSALYVAANCHDPGKITARSGSRDDIIESDLFILDVDPYNDGRSGYTFAVTAGGSVFDGTLYNDVDADYSWDGHWEAKVAIIDHKGWSLEMRIPFNQIRFPKAQDYCWGINFTRQITRKGEIDVFSWAPSTQDIYVSNFAQLTGIAGINPGRHSEVEPYAVGDLELQNREQGNPLQTGNRSRANAGGDFKLGILGNLTLDATVNPDFGQVEVDPAEINLSAYELYYQEKRPFFVEGASIFNGFGRGGLGDDRLNLGATSPQPQFFYSRRIGRAPDPPEVGPGSFVDSPDRTTILGAAKITGRLGNWNIGFVNALTARENATIDDQGGRSQLVVEPFSWHGVFRAQKDVNRGYQGFGVIATDVQRDLPADSALGNRLNKNAFSIGLDGWSFLDNNRDWVVSGWLGKTRIEGTTADILRLQTSALHYFQRPDATHVKVNPTATTLAGWGAGFSLAKKNGNFLFSLRLGALSPGFDPNDIGFQQSVSDVLGVQESASDILSMACFSGYYRDYADKPRAVFKDLTIGVGPFLNYDFGGNKIGEGVVAAFNGSFVNSWQLRLTSRVLANTLDNQLTRGGPLALSPAAVQAELGVRTDSRRNVVLEGDLGFGDQAKNGHLWKTWLDASTWLCRNLRFSIRPSYTFMTTRTQWVDAFPDSRMVETYGSRYVFAQLRQRVVSAEFRFTWAFSPKLSLKAYVNPFIPSDKYGQFKELAKPRTFDFNTYSEGGSTIRYADGRYIVDPDGSGPAPSFSFPSPEIHPKSLSGTIVLRWEYLPDSLIYLVWTRNSIESTEPGNATLGSDLGRLLGMSGKNTVLLKVTYHLNI